MAQRLASHGYVVAVPNLYHRSGAFEPFDPQAVTGDGPERVRFTGMIRSINGSMVMRDTAAVLAHLDGRSDVRPGPHGALGYCMGGGYALLAA
jgi:carboxymethylenebutenolidase